MLKAIADCYRNSARIALALPLLYALGFATELVQHVVEVRIGLFASIDAMRTLGEHPARMGFGYVKGLSLILLVYWVSRWHFAGEGGGRIIGDARSARLFAAVIVYGLLVALLQHYGDRLLAPVIDDPGTVNTAILLLMLLATMADVYLAPWKVSAALGNPRIGIPTSVRLIRGGFWWSFAFSIVTMLPLMALHYALNIFAVGRGAAATWALLVLDAAVVGYLGLVLATATVMIAWRAADCSGARLIAPAEPVIA